MTSLVSLNKYSFSMRVSLTFQFIVYIYVNSKLNEWVFFTNTTLFIGLLLLNIGSSKGDIVNTIRNISIRVWIPISWLFIVAMFLVTQDIDSYFKRFVVSICLTIFYLGFFVCTLKVFGYLKSKLMYRLR